MRDLTYKQKLFITHYLGVSNGNATDAARRAGYRMPEEQGRRLVRKSTIRAAIDAKLASVALSQDEILARLSEIARGDVLDFVRVDVAGGVQVNLKRARRRGKGFLLKR